VSSVSPNKAFFRVVGVNKEYLKMTFDVDIGGSVLMKVELMQKLLNGEIDRAYGTLVPDSEAWKSRYVRKASES
jgi:hypothetical protein